MSANSSTPRTVSGHETMRQMERDLTVYCTSEPDKYLKLFRQAYTDTSNRGVQRNQGSAMSWNWAAFFFTFAWLFYRKMFLLGILFLGLVFALRFFSPGPFIFLFLIFALKIVVALNAKSMYVEKAVEKIRKARSQQIPVRQWDAHLQLIGGVSYLGAIFAIAIMIADSLFVSFTYSN